MFRQAGFDVNDTTFALITYENGAVVNLGVGGAYLPPAGGSGPALLDICLAETEVFGETGAAGEAGSDTLSHAAKAITAISSGTILAIVTMVLTTAACSTPRRIMKWNSQMPIEATAIAITVLPSPKTGKNAPNVDLISTQYETLPTQVPIQKPTAAAKHHYWQKPYLA